jgi:DMSO reductase anchor subunit/ferredoxin
MTGCPTGAYVKLENGIVKQQAEECIGCGYCTWNCPYGVPQFNSERNIVTKCDMCHGRLSEGDMPACVSACPEQAIRIEKVNVSDWRDEHGEANAPHLPDSGMTISTTRITLPKDVPAEMLKANRHHVEPEKPHASLIFMTVLTQLAAGGFLILWLGHLFSCFLDFLKPLQDFMVFGASGMLAVTALALFAAVFHLGRPLYAYKALRMWRRSWLSREVLLFMLFSLTGTAYAAFQLVIHYSAISIHEGLNFALGGFASLLGIAGVYASAKIYLVPARPAWNTVRTPLRFFLTGLILGPLFLLIIYAFYISVKFSAQVSPSYHGPILALLAISVVAGFSQLMVLLARFFYLRESQPDELYGSTFLLVHRFRKHFFARVAFLGVSCFLIPVFLFHHSSLPTWSGGSLIGLTLTCFILALAGEFLGRYLFFVTVVPKNIPGSFFSSNGGAH